MGPLPTQVPEPETGAAPVVLPLPPISPGCTSSVCMPLSMPVFTPTASISVHPAVIHHPYLKGDSNLQISIHVVLPPVWSRLRCWRPA